MDNSIRKGITAEYGFYFSNWGYYYFSAGYFYCKKIKEPLSNELYSVADSRKPNQVSGYKPNYTFFEYIQGRLIMGLLFLYIKN